MPRLSRILGAVTAVAASLGASYAFAADDIGDAAAVSEPAQRLTPVAIGEEEVAARTAVEVINQERAARGLQPYQWDARVADAARAHALDMASMGSMQHAGSDGSDAGGRLDRAGVDWSTWGENLAAGISDPAAVVTAWMNSPGHRANLLSDLPLVGVGVASGADGVRYWSLLIVR